MIGADNSSNFYSTPTPTSGMPTYLQDLGSSFEFDFSNLPQQHDPEFYAQFFNDMSLPT